MMNIRKQIRRKSTQLFWLFQIIFWVFNWALFVVMSPVLTTYKFAFEHETINYIIGFLLTLIIRILYKKIIFIIKLICLLY